MNKELLRMQRLAGLITESQYKKLTENKVSDLIEAFNPFLDTEEGGYMREYIDDVVEDSMGEPESLGLEYLEYQKAFAQQQGHHHESIELEDLLDLFPLDLKYRSEFDTAFNLALTRLKKDHPELDFDAIETNKEAFWQ